MTIVAPSLEIAVLVLGVLVLLFETFADQIDKRTFAYTAMLGLATVFVASFFLAPQPTEVADAGFWSFYTADPLAIFFKRFSLVTTILVLAMMIDYAPVVRDSIPGASLQAGLGEFFALPVLRLRSMTITFRRMPKTRSGLRWRVRMSGS